MTGDGDHEPALDKKPALSDRPPPRRCQRRQERHCWKDAPFTSHERSSDLPESVLGVKVVISAVFKARDGVSRRLLEDAFANNTGRAPLPLPMGANTSVHLKVAITTGRAPKP